jgi:hypothetical protein
MNTIGIVQEVKQRQVSTKYGMKPVYDLVISNTKYGWGFKDPNSLGISVGTEVSFESTSDKYGPKIDPTSLLVLGQGKTPPAKTNGAAGHTSSYRDRGSFPISKSSGEFAIIRQNALTNARELVGLYIAWTADTDLDDVVETIIKVANIFADYSSGQREVKAAEKITKKHGSKTAKSNVSDMDTTVSSMMLDDAADAEESE